MTAILQAVWKQLRTHQRVMVEVNYIEGNLVRAPDWKIQQNKELETIYKKNYSKFKNSLYKLKIQSDRHDDVIQHAFLCALRYDKKIEKIENCMFRAVFNSGLYLKKNKFEKLQTNLKGDFERFTTETPETILLTTTEKNRINKLVNSLPTQQQKCLKMGVMGGQSSTIVGKKLNISPDTAKANWRWGIRTIKNNITSWDIPDTYESEYYIMEDDNA